jgi:hypothetical protein
LSKYTKIKTELDDLFKLGIEILLYHTDSKLQFVGDGGFAIKKPKILDSLPLCYNRWYSLSISTLQSIGVDRLVEFESYYTTKKQIKELTPDNYTISHFLIGRLLQFSSGNNEYHSQNIFSAKFLQQISILESVKYRLDSSLKNITQIVQADLLDSEIETCKQLVKQKYFRAGGVICGVIIERHLNRVCEHRGLTISKKNPTINDFNELLKNNDIIDMVKWREISYLADIRNLCCHNREREPIKEEIDTLIEGTTKLIKTLF